MLPLAQSPPALDGEDLTELLGAAGSAEAVVRALKTLAGPFASVSALIQAVTVRALRAVCAGFHSDVCLL